MWLWTLCPHQLPLCPCPLSSLFPSILNPQTLLSYFSCHLIQMAEMPWSHAKGGNPIPTTPQKSARLDTTKEDLTTNARLRLTMRSNWGLESQANNLGKAGMPFFPSFFYVFFFFSLFFTFFSFLFFLSFILTNKWYLWYRKSTITKIQEVAVL